MGCTTFAQHETEWTIRIIIYLLLLQNNNYLRLLLQNNNYYYYYYVIINITFLLITNSKYQHAITII